MKKKQVTKMLGVFCLCFAVAGGVSAVMANATDESVVLIESGVLKIDGAEVTATSANFATWEKASVRYDATVDTATGKEYTGMRFLSWIDQDVYDALMNSPDYTVSFGTLIANESTVSTATAFTKEGLPANTDSVTYYKDAEVSNVIAEANELSGQTDVVEFSAVLYGTTGTETFAKERMARAYMTVTSIADASQTVTIYANYNAESSRSIADVAMSALEANAYTSATVDPDEKEFKALTTYAKASSAWKTGYDYMRYVSTFDELKTYAPNAGTYIVMKNDISLENVTLDDFTIGTSAYSVVPVLNATLDGNGHKLYGLSATSSTGWSKTNVGFIGRISDTAVVRKLMFEGNLGGVDENNYPNPFYARGVGLLAWHNAGTVEDCYITGDIITNTTYADYDNSTGNYSVGVIYKNSGLVQRIISNLHWSHSKSPSSAPVAVVEDHKRYSFVVSNALNTEVAGEVKDCIAVSERYGTKLGTNNIRSWTTSSFYSEVAQDTTDDAGNKYYTFGEKTVEKYMIAPTNMVKSVTQMDPNRETCYVFDSFEDLLLGTGYSDDWSNYNTYTYETGSLPAYAEASAVDAQSVLSLAQDNQEGKGWTFDTETNMIKFYDTIIYVGTTYSQGIISWKTADEATVSVNGTQVATTQDKCYDIATYFKNNINTLGTGDVEIGVTLGSFETLHTLTIVKPTTLDELKTASANKNAYIYLTQDIDLSQATWTGDGTTTPGSVIPELHGVIEGNGYKLFGLRKATDSAPKHNVGFIGRIKSGAKVENVIFTGSLGYKADGTTVSAIAARTGIFAWENAGTIKNCYIKGEIYTPWKNAITLMYSLIGAVYRNKGAIESVVTDISVQTSEWSADKNPCKFGFAVFNTGIIKNSVTISNAQRTISSGGIQYGWMSNDSAEAFALKGASGEFGTSTETGSTGNFGIGSINTSDAGRTDCYLFTSYANLLAGNGYGDKFNGDEFDKTAYATVDATTAKNALGSAWTYDVDNGKVMLNGIAVN